jgi:hypothetical protein
MSRLTGVVRTALINVLVFFVLFNVIYWAIPAISSGLWSAQHLRALLANVPQTLSLTQSLAWISERWSRTGLPPADYRSHIGWRRVPWAQDGIHVEGPNNQRRTTNGPTSGGAQVYWFGGSTMWGTGVTDSGTIPSQFSARTGIRSENFGDLGYTAHQSLLLLIQLLQEGHRPDLVVFYDGVNEVWAKCRVESVATSTELDFSIRNVLRRSSHPDSFTYYFTPFLKAAENFSRELNRETRGESYDCPSNAEKAEAVADNMIKDWELAKLLTEHYGGKFIAFLQPVVHFSRTKVNHIGGSAAALIERLRPSYEKIYPMLRERVARHGDGFHDIVSAADIDEPVYIDFCHLDRRGNARVLDRMLEIITPLGLKH